MKVPVRVTCDPLLTQVVLVIGEGADEHSVGISAEDAEVMIQQAATAYALVKDERRKTRPQ